MCMQWNPQKIRNDDTDEEEYSHQQQLPFRRPPISHCSEGTCCVGKLRSASAHNKDLLPKDFTARHSTLEGSATCTIDVVPRTVNQTTPLEHILLNVQGMTCTGCEKKLQRSLESISLISNISTSLLLSQAEFDLRSSDLHDGGNIAKLIEKVTGFVCERIARNGEILDLVVDSTFSIPHALPSGVMSINFTPKNTIRVRYNPYVIGARDLLGQPCFKRSSLTHYSLAPRVLSSRKQLHKDIWTTIFSTILTIPVLVMAYADIPPHRILYGALSLVLATIVQAVVGRPFYVRAYKTLRFSKMVEMDMLVVLSTTTAYVFSVICYGFSLSGKALSTNEFFETSTLLITLIMVGRTTAEVSRQQAINSISMESLQTESTIIINSTTLKEHEIDVRLLQYGDMFKVLPHSTIATDGIIVEGHTEVDESMVTGESTLVTKNPGDSVLAGSINQSGTLVVKLTSLPSENTIKIISTMVDEAKASRPKIQEIADRVAGHFVIVILSISGVVFLAWSIVGTEVKHLSPGSAIVNAITYSVATLIVSCPCAIGLAVPMVVVIAGGVGARHGLILKSAQTIEIGRKVSHVVFDKTGTLTQGKLAVIEEEILEPGMIGIIMAMAANSKHPVSQAMEGYLKNKGVTAGHMHKSTTVPGSGIEAVWNGVPVRAGNPYWLGIQEAPQVRRILTLGLTLFCVTVHGRLIAVFGLRDELRQDAITTVNALKGRSIFISIISGDNAPAVASIAHMLGISDQNTRSQCLPGQKQAYIKSLLDSNNKGVVLFCGDGTNDAIALAQASIGMHMNECTDIARGAADVILMRPSLVGILTLIDLSKAFHRRVVFNFAWSFIYNIFAILLAAGAFPKGIRIPPQYAGLGELVSVLPVIAVAMQLKWAKF